VTVRVTSVKLTPLVSQMTRKTERWRVVVVSVLAAALILHISGAFADNLNFTSTGMQETDDSGNLIWTMGDSSGSLAITDAGGNGGFQVPAGSIGQTEIADGSILDNHINASAAIAISKLATGSSAQIIVANAAGTPTWVTAAGDITIATSGAVTIAKIGGGTTITKHLSATSSLSFASLATSSCDQKTIAVTGAAPGDTVYVGATSSIETGLLWSAFISAANTVTVRICNVTGPTLTPATSTWRADVWQH